ncbi:MAG: glucosamine-6-phosphate deaminase [Bdellovibrionales bacterium]|nr:glucosamine-6-phosphate deaminase [Bdellovibrionales bacterium]
MSQAPAGGPNRSQARLWRFDNANALYYALVDTLKSEITKMLDAGRNPVVALPTGNTMLPLYKLITDAQEALRTDTWTCINLDEYYPLTSSNRGSSFATYLNQHFYSKLKKPVHLQEQINGQAPDATAECERVENKISELGGIDIALLGLGTNGHIAFNEPGSEFDSRTRLIKLHPDTLMANFRGREPIENAITMGIGTLLESKTIFIVALGKNKTGAVRAAIQDPSSRTCPASGLQKHKNTTWFLDQEASSLI